MPKSKTRTDWLGGGNTSALNKEYRIGSNAFYRNMNRAFGSRRSPTARRLNRAYSGVTARRIKHK